jgi:hypothetical protein
LDKIDLETAACRPDSQTGRPGGFSDSLAVINVNKAEAFGLDDSGTFLQVKNFPDLLSIHPSEESCA